MHKKKVPQLRFDGFEEEWEQLKLNKLLEEFVVKSKVEDEYVVLSSTNEGME